MQPSTYRTSATMAMWYSKDSPVSPYIPPTDWLEWPDLNRIGSCQSYLPYTYTANLVACLPAYLFYYLHVNNIAWRAYSERKGGIMSILLPLISPRHALRAGCLMHTICLMINSTTDWIFPFGDYQTPSIRRELSIAWKNGVKVWRRKPGVAEDAGPIPGR